MDTLLAIASRRDERRTLPEPLAPELALRLLDAGRLSGSSRNSQPWTFVVPTGRARIEELAGAVFVPENVLSAGLVVAILVRGTAGIEQHRALAAHEDRHDEPGAENVLRHEDRAGELLDPRSPGRHDERPGLSVPRRSRESPGVEQPERELGRQRLGQRATLVAPAGDREQRVHPGSLVRMAQPVDQETVSLLRWLRRQLRQPTPEREHLEAAVAHDDPAEARRLLRRYDFSDAQRRHVEGLIDRWEASRGAR